MRLIYQYVFFFLLHFLTDATYTTERLTVQKNTANIHIFKYISKSEIPISWQHANSNPLTPDTKHYRKI